jgi:hypothetical protein
VLRFLVVAHRQGANTTPLLELDRREALEPGLSPDTRTMTVTKRRGRKRISLSLKATGSQDAAAHETTASDLVELWRLYSFQAFAKTELEVSNGGSGRACPMTNVWKI